MHRIQVLTLLTIENVLSAVELEAGSTAKILHIDHIFTISFLSALFINFFDYIVEVLYIFIFKYVELNN